MAQRGIFIKIYLWFWVTIVLITAAQITFERLTEHGPPFIPHLQNTLKVILSTYGQAVLDYRMRGDTKKTAELAETVRQSTGVLPYLLGPSDTRDPSVPEDVRGIAAKAAQTGKAEFFFAHERSLMAVPVTAPDGRNYYAAGGMTRHAFGMVRPKASLITSRVVLVLALSAVVCYLLARYLTSPIIRLRDATRRLANGELTVRIGKAMGRRRDELSNVAEDFDHMAGRIESLMLQQRQLIADISHELRSPLARLNLALEIARSKSGPEAAPALNRIETEASMLNEMIGEILTLTRIESGIEGVRQEPVDLARLLTYIADDADFEARARGCTVRVIESTHCTVSGNEELLRRAIENIVRNAVRYTAGHTTVDIGLRRIEHASGAWAEITVRDHGPGVPETELQNLFRPFYRLSNARDRQTGGNGLGLAITQRAVLLHHGLVTISNASDGGLMAVVRLPLSNQASTDSFM